MLFKVTHINEQGHRRRAQISARSSQDATDQMERVYGEARAGACMRMARFSDWAEIEYLLAGVKKKMRRKS